MNKQNIPVSHACFFLQNENKLLIPDNVLSDYAVWHYLSHCISRKPKNLHNHTRRILYCRKPFLNQYLPGALHDLFVVLGDCGYQLRKHLFETCQTFMGKYEVNYFQQWLTEQSRPNKDLQHFKGALLKNSSVQHTKNNKIVRERRHLAAGYNSILQEVQDRMAEGQVQIAKELIEDSNLNGHSSPELELILNEIHQHDQIRELFGKEMSGQPEKKNGEGDISD